jgi:RNA polymerase sigma-70 factor (ECF subfamily)
MLRTLDRSPEVEFDGGAVEEAVFTRLYVTHSVALTRYVERIVGDSEAALDITHDTLIKAYEQSPHLAPGGPPIRAWLFHVARNAALDHRRWARHAVPEAPDAVARRRDAGDATPLEWGSTAEVHAELDLLPEAQRDVTVLRYRGGMSPAETGTALGKSADAVRQLEHRALRHLRAALPHTAR